MRLSGPPRWWELHENIVQLLNYMLELDAYTKHDLVYAVEKPWKYEAEFIQAGGKIEEDD